MLPVNAGSPRPAQNASGDGGAKTRWKYGGAGKNGPPAHLPAEVKHVGYGAATPGFSSRNLSVFSFFLVFWLFLVFLHFVFFGSGFLVVFGGFRFFVFFRFFSFLFVFFCFFLLVFVFFVFFRFFLFLNVFKRF